MQHPGVSRFPASQEARIGESENTRRSYQEAVRYWRAWFTARYGNEFALPISAHVVVQFIADHAVREVAGQGTVLTAQLSPETDEALVARGHKQHRGPYALSTIEHRLAVLSKAHKELGFASPCASKQVRDFMRCLRSEQASHGMKPHELTKITVDLLRIVLASCDDSMRGKRDRALLLFGWCGGGRRCSEIAGAMMENLRQINVDKYEYNLGRFKSSGGDMKSLADDKPILGVAAHALKQWLDACGITQGPIFRRIRKGSRVLDEGLTPDSVRLIVKHRCEEAGLSGNFSTHSLRSGFVAEAGRRGVRIEEVMAMTGHRDGQAFMTYYGANKRPLSPLAIRLLEDDPSVTRPT